MLVADGELDISSINTTYTLKRDTIRLVPDEIIFNNDTVYDKYKNIGIINGAIKHKNLTQLTYELKINAEKMLVYDISNDNDNTFGGTVFATGNCDIHGQSGMVRLDINITPEKNSFIEYDVSHPDAISDNKFIIWHDATPKDSSNNDLQQEKKETDISTNIILDFHINCTKDATLKLIMDRQTNDLIELNGEGEINAEYSNKGHFVMNGNYIVDHGIYKLTIENVIKKDFIFQQGGTIAFNGDPYNADINLKALYTVNGVSLSDLQIGKNFKENNTRVDCLLNITGTPNLPKVAFDLNLPTLGTDAQQMVKNSLILKKI